MYVTRNFKRDNIEFGADTPPIASCLRALLSGVFGVSCAEDSKITISLPSDLDLVFNELGEGAAASLDCGVFVCEGCRQSFLRGAFIECGTVNAPGRACHFEFAVADEKTATELAALLNELGFSPGVTVRSSFVGVYFKGSEAVEDILNLIGAQRAAFALMDAKIVRELRNEANRRVNCDTANISKTVDAAQNHIEAIERVLTSGAADLPPALLITARLRIDNPDATLAELAALHDPPLTKSGVKHRLDRLVKML